MESSDGTDWIRENLNVSRETLDALHSFCGLVQKWNPKINLVAKATIPSVWQRHIVDSAQLMPLIPEEAEDWYDLGSGGGFPALVCAIIGRETRPKLKITCVESDQRKSAFLTVAVQSLGLNVQILTKRAEELGPEVADVISARALKSLKDLLTYKHLLRPNGMAIFPKGAKHREEVNEALAQWQFSLQIHPSVTEQEAAVLCIRDIARV